MDKQNIQAPTIHDLDRAVIRRAVMEVTGLALLALAAMILWLLVAPPTWESILRGTVLVVVLDMVVLGLSFIFKEPAIERVAKISLFVFVKTVPLFGRIRNAAEGLRKDGAIDRMAQKAFAEVFTRGGSPTRDHLYAELRIFESPAQWDYWRKRCVDKEILSVGGRGGGLLAVKGITADEAWKRWTAPSGKWRRNPKTDRLEEQ